MAWRIGIDIGGTFTDVAMVEEDTGRIGIAKVLTTPRDFGQGVIDGISRGLGEQGIAAADVALLSHATTVVTNALLEKKGARCGFVATRGFRDLLELRRSSRPDLYDLFQDGPGVLVPRRHRFEITERIDAQGAVVTPLADDEIPALIAAIRAADMETVAVSFLFSFLNDAHERRVGAAIRAALPNVGVFLSCEVLPEIREFERASTTAVCAYVGPLLAGYLDRLSQATRAMGLPALQVMGSSGGVFDIAEGLRMPAMAVESGPAAGVIAAALAGRQLDRPNLISFDMGGTTAKASVIVNGEIAVTAEYEVGGAANAKRWMHGTGHPIRVPVIDLAEVSAGGGSIAWVDPGGALKVGPHSAGADPGPAAYGRGGLRPTVTDANVILGHLDREALLGGGLPIDYPAAEKAVLADVGNPYGLSAADAAERIVRVVNSNMAQALRIVSVERGYDPREFSLIAFGGAGPVHAVALADELGIPEVIIPPAPGAFSALGLVATDLKRDYARSLYADLGTVPVERVAGTFDAMNAAGAAMLAASNVPQARRDLVRMADVRYRRQAYELTIPVAPGPITRATLDALGEAFHARHEQTYGHANRAEPVQLVTLRLTAFGRRADLRLARPGDAAMARVRHDRLCRDRCALAGWAGRGDGFIRSGGHRGARFNRGDPARLGGRGRCHGISTDRTPDMTVRWPTLGLYVLVLGLLAIPVFSVTVPPLVDYPNHLARMHILASYDTSPALRASYVVNWRISAYLGMDLLVPALARVMPIYVAGQVFLYLCLAAFVLGTAAINAALFRRLSFAPAAAALFAYSNMFTLGFANYLMGVGVWLLAFAGWIVLSRGPAALRAVGGLVLGLLVFFCHLFAFSGFVLCVGGYELGVWLAARPRTVSGLVRRVAVAAGAVLPVLVLVGIVMAGQEGGTTRFTDFGDKLLALLTFLPMPFPGMWFLGVCLAMVGLAIWGFWSGHLRLAPAMAGALLAIGLPMLLMPQWLSGVWGVDRRLPAVFVFLLLASVQWRGLPIGVTRGLSVLLVAVFALEVGGIVQAWAPIGAQFDEFRAAMPAIEPGARVIAFMEDEGAEPTPRRGPLGLYYHLAMLSVIERDAFSACLFHHPLISVGYQPALHAVVTAYPLPIPIAWMVAGADPMDGPAMLGRPHPLTRVNFWGDWPHHYDYAIGLNFAGAVPVPRQLALVKAGSFFNIYRVER